MTPQRHHRGMWCAVAIRRFIAFESKGGRRQKKKIELFRWGMGGGCGRPFFNALAPSRKFPAVMIVVPLNCCGAVSALDGRKILATEAPRLPMPGCTMPDRCRCKFRKYEDRRDDDEGRRFRGGQERSAWYAGGQRRKSRGRRTVD